MANHEEEDVSANQGGDWLAEAVGTEDVSAEPAVESAPQSTGEEVTVPDQVEVEPTPRPDTATSGRERDERGRFKAKSSTQEPPAEAEPPTQENEPAEAAAQEPEPTQKKSSDEEDDSRDNIPSWRLREEKEARRAEQRRREEAEHAARAYQAQAAQLQQYIAAMQQQLHALQNPPKQQQPVDIFQDPDGFVGNVEQRFDSLRSDFQRELRKIRLEANLATTAHLYKDEFPEALQAFEAAAGAGDQALKHRVFGSSDPGGTILAWYREQKALKEIGPDPNAYIQKKLEEALNDPAYLARALEAAKAKAIGQPAAPAAPGQPAARPNTVIKRPPSLSGVPGGASAHAASSASGGGDWLSEALNGR